MVPKDSPYLHRVGSAFEPVEVANSQSCNTRVWRHPLHPLINSTHVRPQVEQSFILIPFYFAFLQISQLCSYCFLFKYSNSRSHVCILTFSSNSACRWAVHYWRKVSTLIFCFDETNRNIIAKRWPRLSSACLCGSDISSVIITFLTRGLNSILLQSFPAHLETVGIWSWYSRIFN